MAGQLPTDFDKLSKEEKAKANNRDFFDSIAELKIHLWKEDKIRRGYRACMKRHWDHLDPDVFKSFDVYW